MRLQRRRSFGTGGWQDVIHPTDSESKILLLFDLTFDDISITQIQVEGIHNGEVYSYRALRDEGGAGDREKLVPKPPDPKLMSSTA